MYKYCETTIKGLTHTMGIPGKEPNKTKQKMFETRLMTENFLN